MKWAEPDGLGSVQGNTKRLMAVGTAFVITTVDDPATFAGVLRQPLSKDFGIKAVTAGRVTDTQQKGASVSFACEQISHWFHRYDQGVDALHNCSLTPTAQQKTQEMNRDNLCASAMCYLRKP